MEANNTLNVAVIPARSGSKRISDKNIKPFAGKPLICYSIKAALESKLFSSVIVSTDDENIAEIAQACGAEAPFFRPNNLADDFTPVGEVVDHCADWLTANRQRPDYLCCIYATAPMIESEDIVRGYRSLRTRKEFKQALAVTEFEFPIQRALCIDGDKGLRMIQPQYQLTRSQDLQPCYHDAGQFFWIKNSWEGVDRNLGSLPILIDRSRVHDIDTNEDWVLAEYMYRSVTLRLNDEVKFKVERNA